MRRVVGSILVSLLVGLGLATPGQAFAASGTAVLSPSPGQEVLTGFHTVQVRLVDEQAGPFHLLVFGCDSDYYEWVDFAHDGTDRTYSLEFSALTCEAYDYNANLFRGVSTSGGAEFVTGNDFSVVTPDPLPVIKSFAVSPKVIYPTVQEGYRDYAKIDWEARDWDNRGRVDILNAGGRVIASKNGWTGFWTWRGKNANGERVKPGEYKVRLTLWNAQGRSVRSTRRLTVKREYAPGTTRITRVGTNTTSRSKRGNCFIRGYDGELTLDCWNGRYAQARYVFRVPSNAHDFKWSVEGTVNCCNRGRIIKTAKRLDARRYAITVRVTNWRSYTVEFVSLKYAMKKWWRPVAGENQQDLGQPG